MLRLLCLYRLLSALQPMLLDKDSLRYLWVHHALCNLDFPLSFRPGMR